MKICNKCNKTKELNEFYKSKEGQQRYCKSCINFYNSENAKKPEVRKRRKDYHVKQRLKVKYNIDFITYNKMVAKQNNLCSICKKAESEDKLLAVDHCHKTGKIRELLCGKCNKGIGLFQDEPELLMAAA